MEERKLKKYIFKNDEEFFCLDFINKGVRKCVDGIKREEPNTLFWCDSLVEKSSIFENNYIRFFKEIVANEGEAFLVNCNLKGYNVFANLFLDYVYHVSFLNDEIIIYNILITFINESGVVCKKTNEEIEEIIGTTGCGGGHSYLMNCYYKIFPPKQYVYKRVLEILKK